MRIALAQICTTGDVARNLELVRDGAKRAAAEGAAAVVFPEATMVAFGNDLARAADAHLADWRQALAALAAEAGLTVVAGEFEPAADGRVRNLLAVYRPDGGRDEYQKVHLFDAFGFQESQDVAPGEESRVIDLDGTRVGLAVCYDVRFPKLFAELSRAGAQVSIVSASWGAGPGKAEQWNLLTRARALDSNTYVVAVGQADPVAAGEAGAVAGAPTGVGGSLVADPFGHVVAELGAGADFAVVDLDLSVVERAEQAIPVLRNARLGY